MNDTSLDPGRVPVSINSAVCTDCRKCLDACPTDVFHVNDQSQRVEARFPRDCHVCFLCVTDCPTGAIKVDWDAPNPRHRSVYDVLEMDMVPFGQADRPESA